MSKRSVLFLVLLVLFLFGTNASAAKQITVCIAAPGIKKNPLYYHMPNTQTRLLCELGNTKSRPTLRNLYNSGWRLIHVESINRPSNKKKKPSPILYLEREVSNKAKKKRVPKKESSNNFFDDLL